MDKKFFMGIAAMAALTLVSCSSDARIQQASAKLRNVFVKALLWC